MMERVKRIAGYLAESGTSAMLVMQPENRLYLSGFTGSSGAVLVTEKKSFLITDFRYIEQAKQQSPHLEIYKLRETMEDTLADMVSSLGLKSITFEADYISYHCYEQLKGKLQGVELKPATGVVERGRQVKDSGELLAIARSMSLLDDGFDFICGRIKPGITEQELEFELETYLRQKGASGPAFPFIIASGPRSSLPHGTATDRVIGYGDLITLDFGVVLDNYNSDMTRTVALGEPPAELKKIYSIVLEAQLAGLAAVRAGITASSADSAARQVIESYGYGGYFGHGTGHGVGLAVHEAPRLSSRDNTVLLEGMVVTVEPGIYLPGVGGVRIEDSVVVEKDGCRVLTKSPKDKLIILA
ncbi:Xaa-Pro dipeptidase [Desulfotomaculum arcticum]|uniref:Xaa-Pro dipeptidase n=1 Tax=Desulfotruncus arcticus DSM 17038 TaxID=1121424 RepID=A0A1I2MNN6_9FIRM|nr:Xaa-Pro peptidase family protein [Desulfotruncus arcticus]SFF93175.1 Xaa-Pro dipeptidase [Desulfotomaculum arcticum] [Desulfotruncus arcticus DSM 17038]